MGAQVVSLFTTWLRLEILAEVVKPFFPGSSTYLHDINPRPGPFFFTERVKWKHMQHICCWSCQVNEPVGFDSVAKLWRSLNLPKGKESVSAALLVENTNRLLARVPEMDTRCTPNPTPNAFTPDKGSFMKMQWTACRKYGRAPLLVYHITLQMASNKGHETSWLLLRETWGHLKIRN